MLTFSLRLPWVPILDGRGYQLVGNPFIKIRGKIGHQLVGLLNKINLPKGDSNRNLIGSSVSKSKTLTIMRPYEEDYHTIKHQSPTLLFLSISIYLIYHLFFYISLSHLNSTSSKILRDLELRWT